MRRFDSGNNYFQSSDSANWTEDFFGNHPASHLEKKRVTFYITRFFLNVRKIQLVKTFAVGKSVRTPKLTAVKLPPLLGAA